LGLFNFTATYKLSTQLLGKSNQNALKLTKQVFKIILLGRVFCKKMTKTKHFTKLTLLPRQASIDKLVEEQQLLPNLTSLTYKVLLVIIT